MRSCKHPAESPYGRDLDRNPANHAPLTPLSFLSRAADVYPDRTAVVHGARTMTYRTLNERSLRLASALERAGIVPGDTVAIMAPNIPAMIEAHHGVPMAGAVLNALNYRLDAASLAFILDHSDTRMVLCDSEFAPVMAEALNKLDRTIDVVDIVDDPAMEHRIGEVDYETFLERGDPAFDPLWPEDEWQAITLNYTSGTTGNPKGVVYHHRGAHLNAVGDILVWEMGHFPVYLWTLP
ncbi:MAG: AMP-binding protein, partial [Geminicoccaceae bacterium]|nr:AMP-binding protein [Geminicoccaceae bacterium]